MAKPISSTSRNTLAAISTSLNEANSADAKNDNVAGFGINQGVLGRPREWSVTLKRRF